ncbi:MAG: hypothetical protein ACREUU_06855 [Gammaproteobacteria bacterium]
MVTGAACKMQVLEKPGFPANRTIGGKSRLNFISFVFNRHIPKMARKA